MAKINPIEFQRYLKGMDYPAALDAILEKAKENHAPEEIVQMLEKIEDREYKTPADVMKGVGEVD